MELSISVAMATCNGAGFLETQLMDLRRQTRLPAELVVCDDCSDDETLEIIERFSRITPFPVRIHRNSTRLGYRANFIKCAGLCRSDIVAFCDQDDRWSPDKLATVVRPFDNADVLLVHHNAVVIDANEVPLEFLRPEGSDPILMRQLSVSPWIFPLGFTQAFRKSLLDYDAAWPSSMDHNQSGEAMAHDQWYHFLAGSLGDIVYIPKVLANYRQHDANLFGWRRSMVQSLYSRISYEVSRGGRSIARRAEAARLRANTMHMIAPSLDGEARSRAQLAASAYLEMAERCAIRASLYVTSGLRNRVRILRRLIQQRGYGRDSWRFGFMALAMDITVGLLALHPQRDFALGVGAEQQSC